MKRLFPDEEITVGNNGYDQCFVHPTLGKVKNKVETNLAKARLINKTIQLV
jgi:hypothetical protein